MKIEVVLAPNAGPMTLDGTRSYVIEGAVVIDPGPAIDSHVEAMRSRLQHPEGVLLTHRHGDHVPAAEVLRRKLGLPVYGPAGVGIDLDRVVSDGQTLTFGSFRVTVIATPGHTAEHVCYLGEGGELFTGDTVLGAGTTAILPPDGDMGDYIASLQRLLALRPRVIYPGHGPVREQATDLISGYIEHRRMRERQILRALESGATTIEQIRADIYEDLDPRLHAAADSQISAHLIDLERRGAIQRTAAGVELRR